jgi:hypothetical protein
MSGSGFLQRKLIIKSHFAERNSRCNPHFENWRNPAFGMGDAAGAPEQAAKMQSRSMVAQQLATTKALRPKTHTLVGSSFLTRSRLLLFTRVFSLSGLI